MAFLFPFLTLGSDLHFSVPVLVVLLGLSLIFISSITLYRHGTTLNPLKPQLASILVTSGLYRYSRNPDLFWPGIGTCRLGCLFAKSCIVILCAGICALYQSISNIS